MQNSVFYLACSALIPILCADVTAGPASYVHGGLVAVVTVGALPKELSALLNHLDLTVPAADLTVVALGVELCVHYVVVDEAHNVKHGGNVGLHIGNLDVRDRSARGERLEFRLKSKL